MIIKLQQLKCKTKINFYQEIGNYYDEMNYRRQSGTFQFEEDPSSKNVQGVGKTHHGVFLSRNFSETKPSVKSTNIN